MIKENFDWTPWVEHGKLSRARGLIQAICEFSKDQDTARVAAEVGHLLDEFNTWFLSRETLKTSTEKPIVMCVGCNVFVKDQVVKYIDKYKMNLCVDCHWRMDDSER